MDGARIYVVSKLGAAGCIVLPRNSNVASLSLFGGHLYSSNILIKGTHYSSNFRKCMGGFGNYKSSLSAYQKTAIGNGTSCRQKQMSVSR